MSHQIPQLTAMSNIVVLIMQVGRIDIWYVSQLIGDEMIDDINSNVIETFVRADDNLIKLIMCI